MIKLTLIFLLSLYSSVACSQQDMFVLKKGSRTVALFRKDSYIAFQAENGEWFSGNITKIQNDSFFIKPMIVHYNMMGTDTVYYADLPFALTDVFALPGKGLKIGYRDGHFQIIKSAGHVHFYWIRSGWIFRAGAVGYIGLNITNTLIKNDPPFARKNKARLGIAAAVFLFGKLLHLKTKFILRMGKKYHLQSIHLASAPNIPG